MQYDFTYMLHLKSKINGQQQQNRNILEDTENRPMVARGKGVRGQVKKEKGLRSANWSLQNSPGDATYSMGISTITLQ